MFKKILCFCGIHRWNKDKFVENNTTKKITKEIYKIPITQFVKTYTDDDGNTIDIMSRNQCPECFRVMNMIRCSENRNYIEVSHGKSDNCSKGK